MLEGSLETFPLSSVVRLIEDSAATGRLAVQAPLGTGSLVFQGGRLVDALPAPAGDPLEGALSLFEHRSGRFSFRPETPGEVTLNLDVAGLLELVAERDEAWAKIREIVPGDIPLSVLPERRIDGMVTVSAQFWRVAVLAGGRTPAQLASACGMSEFAVCTILVDLVEQGLLVSLAHHGDAPVRQTRQRTDADPVLEADQEIEAGAAPERLYPPEPVAEEDVDPSDLLRELGETPPAQNARKRR